jgi:hypothetical protein
MTLEEWVSSPLLLALFYLRKFVVCKSCSISMEKLPSFIELFLFLDLKSLCLCLMVSAEGLAIFCSFLVLFFLSPVLVLR